MSEPKLELELPNKRRMELELVKAKAASRTKRRIADYQEQKALKELEDKVMSGEASIADLSNATVNGKIETEVKAVKIEKPAEINFKK